MARAGIPMIQEDFDKFGLLQLSKEQSECLLDFLAGFADSVAGQCGRLYKGGKGDFLLVAADRCEKNLSK